jgi:MFS family permease
MTRTKTALGSRYRRLYIATIVSNLGDGVASVAYPWLASAVTRSPLLVSLVVVAQRLPWLVFTLPAGVITDRVDRRRAMAVMDGLRFALTLVVALAVLGWRKGLPGPRELDMVVGTRTGLYVVVLFATLLLGMAEVLRDNCGQTIMPNLVDDEHLETANGRLWAAEGIANTFVGPPLGSVLLIASFALPFFVDAASFFAAAALVASIPGSFRAERIDGAPPAGWKAELAEGVRWLWRHELLRPMAIMLGLMNLASMLGAATLVLFAQEVLNIGPVLFAVLGFGYALGGIVAGTFASRVSKRFGSGTCLSVTLIGSAVVAITIGLLPHWPVVVVMYTVLALLGTLWNVITVSLRQSIIPAHLLGRVNSVYRFFAWGMMPIGAALGGLIVWFVDRFASRDWGLRAVYFVDAGIHVALFVVGASKLTTAKIEAARGAAVG